MSFRAAFTRLVDVLGTVIFSVITLVCFAQIINRYFFGRSFVFAEEMAVQLMIWIAFLGAAKCVAEDSHARMTLLPSMLSPRGRSIALVVSNLLCIGFLAVSAGYGFRLVRTTWNSTTIGTGIPEGLVYLAMPVGSVIMIVFLLGNSIAAIRQTGRPETTP